MSLLLSPPSTSPALTEDSLGGGIRACSVVPGRQRWEVPALLGRPALARMVESTLLAVPGITKVHANAVSGRVLVLHDRTLSPRLAARSLRQALMTVRSPAPGTAAQGEGSAQRSGAGAAGGTGSAGPVAVAGAGAAAVVALGCGKTCAAVLLNPVVSLGAVAVATTIVIRRAWRRSGRGQAPPAAADGPDHRRALSRIIGPHRRQFRRAATLTALGQVAESALFATVSFAVMTVAGGGSPALSGLGLTGLPSQLAFLAAAGAVACVGVAGFAYAADVAWRKLSYAVEHDWRTSTYAAAQRLPRADLEGERTSRVSRVLTEDISQMGTFVAGGLQDCVALAASIGVLIPSFLLVAPQIAWAAFMPLPLITWLSFRYHERAVANQAASGEGRARLHARLVDNLQANATIKAACTEDHEAARISELSTQQSTAGLRTDSSTALQAQVVRLFAMGALPSTLLAGGRAVLAGTLSLESFGLLVELPGQALWRMSRLGTLTDQYRKALAALERVEHLRRLPAETDGQGRALPADQATGTIALKKVTFAYPGRPPTLTDLSMDIRPGQVTGIVGTTGAGKTTVAKLLMRFQHADEGHVLLGGTDVRELRLRDLRGAIGYVAQDPFLFDGTIADNIRYGTFHADHAQIVQAASTAGAATFIEAFPAGYDTMVGERGAALSGGQRQRIALARTILKDPPIVILDEATSAVDNETEAAIQRGLQAFSADRTLIVIAHRLSTIRNADMIYVMDHGGVVAEAGTHADLIRRGGRYAKLWRLQAGEDCDEAITVTAS